MRVSEIDGWAVQSILVSVLRLDIGTSPLGTLEIGEFWKGMIGDWTNESQCPSWGSRKPVLIASAITTTQSLTHHGLTPTNPSKQQLVRFAASGGGAREDRTAAVPSLEQRSASAAVSAGARRSRPVALPRDEGPLSLFRGAFFRVALYAPSAVVFFFVYDAVKRSLGVPI